MRLINADALCEYANNSKDKQIDANDIMRFPKIDAIPARHGKWEEKEVVDNTGDTTIQQWQSARCSVCRRYHTTPYLYHHYHFNYCPHCGTKMEE